MSHLLPLDSPGLVRSLLNLGQTIKLQTALGVTPLALEEWADGRRFPPPSVERTLRYYCVDNDFTDLLLRHGGVPPSYNHLKPFSFANTPVRSQRPLKQKLYLINRPTQIAGKRVNFPLGIPASALTGTSEWIEFYAALGFDILTYKTVRTVEWPAHQYPNWAFVTNPKPLTADDTYPHVADQYAWPVSPTDITMVNSFGIPSQSPEVWQRDVEKAKASLSPGQVLIVSVMGSKDSFAELCSDFATAASMAKDAGADIIELNLSCPNLRNPKKGLLYTSPKEAVEVIRSTWNALGRGVTPLFIKIGCCHYNTLSELLESVASLIAGVSAINTVSQPVIKPDGSAFFPPNPVSRAQAGVSGTAIKGLAQETVKELSFLRYRNNYDFDILGMGGVTSASDVQDYLDLGANGVQSCTGAWNDPFLAINTRLQTSGSVSPKYTTALNGNGNQNELGGEMHEQESYTTVDQTRVSSLLEKVEQLHAILTQDRDPLEQLKAAEELVEISRQQREVDDLRTR